MRRISEVNLSPKTAAKAERIADAIRSVADPKLILLFGSRARGDDTAESDFDILVVHDPEDWKSPTPFKESVRLSAAINEYMTPVDLLLFTSAEFDKWRHACNHVIARALDDGVVLYDRR